jgi:hypothetical protein
MVAKDYPTIDASIRRAQFCVRVLLIRLFTVSVNYMQGLLTKILGEEGQCDLMTEESFYSKGQSLSCGTS